MDCGWLFGEVFVCLDDGDDVWRFVLCESSLWKKKFCRKYTRERYIAIHRNVELVKRNNCLHADVQETLVVLFPHPAFVHVR